MRDDQASYIHAPFAALSGLTGPWTTMTAGPTNTSVDGGVVTRRQAAMVAASRQAGTNQQQVQQLYQAGGPHALPYLDASQSLNSSPNGPESIQIAQPSLSSIPNSLPASHQPLTPVHPSSPVYGRHRPAPTLQLSPSAPTTSSYSFHPARSSSPANSVASTALTSLSGGQGSAHPSMACSPHTNDDPVRDVDHYPSGSPPRKKQKLFGLDRKSICYYAKANPGARQEDIAARYGVERSTISKILKQKAKWMQLQTNEEMKTAKHRPSKFPQIEAQLAIWVKQCVRDKTLMTDALIKQKAKETARAIGIGEDRFKASSGWIENFKNRHNIRRGTQTSPPTHYNVVGLGNEVDATDPLSPHSPLTSSPSHMQHAQQQLLDDTSVFHQSPPAFTPSDQQHLDGVLGDAIDLSPGHRTLSHGRQIRSHSLSSLPGSSSHLRYSQTMPMVDILGQQQSPHEVFSPGSHRGHSHSNSQSSITSFTGVGGTVTLDGSPLQQHALTVNLDNALSGSAILNSPFLNQAPTPVQAPRGPRRLPPGCVSSGTISDANIKLDRLMESMEGSPDFISPDDFAAWLRIRTAIIEWCDRQDTDPSTLGYVNDVDPHGLPYAGTRHYTRLERMGRLPQQQQVREEEERRRQQAQGRGATR